MSQSDEHRSLVMEAERILTDLSPNLPLLVDLQQTPGDSLPPMISGYRPDVYGIKASENFALIGEAKTRSDLRKPRTFRQILSFATYLKRRNKSLLLLAVPPETADQVKTLLWFTRRQVQPRSTHFIIFDGLDLWHLRPTEGLRWRLS